MLTSFGRGAGVGVGAGAGGNGGGTKSSSAAVGEAAAAAASTSFAALQLVRVYKAPDKSVSKDGNGVPVRALCFHPDGGHLVVVTGGPGPDGKERSMRPGRFVVLDVDSLESTSEGKAAKKWCGVAR